MTAVQAVALMLVAVAGTVVVSVREPARQAVASGLFGLSPRSLSAASRCRR